VTNPYTQSLQSSAESSLTQEQMPIESPPGFTEQSVRKQGAPYRNVGRMIQAGEEISLPPVPEQELAQLSHRLRLHRARLMKDYQKEGLTLEILDKSPPDVDKLIQIGLDHAKDVMPLLELRIAVAQAEYAAARAEIAALQANPSTGRSTGTLAPRTPTQSALFPKLTGVGRKTRKHGYARLRRRARRRLSRRKVKA
jgi:hypothetical protein